MYLFFSVSEILRSYKKICGYSFYHRLFIISQEGNLFKFRENILASHHFSQISKEIEVDISIFLSYSVSQWHIVNHWCVFVAASIFFFALMHYLWDAALVEVLPKVLTVKNRPITRPIKNGFSDFPRTFKTLKLTANFWLLVFTQAWCIRTWTRITVCLI